MKFRKKLKKFLIMGSNDSKLNGNNKFKKLNKEDKNCIKKLVKKSLNSIPVYNQHHYKQDFRYMKSGSTSSDDFSESSSIFRAPYKKLIEQDYIDDLSHDSIASSFVFASAAGYNNANSAKPSLYYNQFVNSPSQSHVRVYHDIYYF